MELVVVSVGRRSGYRRMEMELLRSEGWPARMQHGGCVAVQLLLLLLLLLLLMMMLLMLGMDGVRRGRMSRQGRRRRMEIVETVADSWKRTGKREQKK